MSTDKLSSAVSAVDWNRNVAAFLKHTASVEALAKANLRLAHWARQFETIDEGNPALCFVREMQVASQHVTALTALALYKPAAASMRTILETALYYTYFRTHPTELTTLVRDPSFYLEKRELLEFHKNHTPDFVKLQGKLGLLSRLENWYSMISAIVHGQIPGTWTEHNSIREIAHIPETLDIVTKTYVEGEDVVHRLFLCTVGRLLWDGFSSTAKKNLLSGLHGELKEVLGLDVA